MSRMIDADRLLDWFKHHYKHEEFCAEYICGIINEQPTVPQWIPCSERMPSEGTEHLITRHGEIEIAYYEGKDLWRGLQGLTAFTTDVVTAWMELPEPDKGE